MVARHVHTQELRIAHDALLKLSTDSRQKKHTERDPVHIPTIMMSRCSTTHAVPNQSHDIPNLKGAVASIGVAYFIAQVLRPNKGHAPIGLVPVKCSLYIYIYVYTNGKALMSELSDHQEEKIFTEEAGMGRGLQKGENREIAASLLTIEMFRFP